MKLSILVRRRALVAIVAALLFAGVRPLAAVADTKPSSESKSSAKVDLNTATEVQLQELPGIGEATAKKIVKARPFKSIDDLSKAGVPSSTITKLRSSVSVSTEKSTKKEDKATTRKSTAKEEKKSDKSTASSSKSTAKDDKSDKSTSSTSKSTAKDEKSDKATSKSDKAMAKDDKADKSAAKSDKSTAKSDSRTDKSTSKTDDVIAKTDKPTPIEDKTTAKSSKPAVVDSKASLINLNKASETELETVSGIGPAYAHKIIDHRPYKSIDELSKAGIPSSTISKIRPLVTISDSAMSQTTVAKPVTPDKTPALIDVNKATAEQLQELPGIGEVYSKKIIDNRPYKSIDDLSKTGIPAAELDKIKSQLTVGGVTAVAAPSKGMVWVNLETKLYHHESSRWYGKTKSGKYMSEAEAEKDGYKASKQ